MKITNLPSIAMARLLQLETDARNAQAAARDAADAVAHARNSLHTKFEREDLERTEAMLPGLIADAEATANRYTSLTTTVERCHRWIAGLPDDAICAEYLACSELPENPHEALKETREQLAAAIKERNDLSKVPVPSDDIDDKVAEYVADLAQRAKPYVRGVGNGQKLSVRWPSTLTSRRNDTGNWPTDTVNPLLMVALLMPQELKRVIHMEIAREANEGMTIKQREQRIAELTDEIEELQRQASDMVHDLCALGDEQTFHSAPPEAVLAVILRDEKRAA